MIAVNVVNRRSLGIGRPQLQSGKFAYAARLLGRNPGMMVHPATHQRCSILGLLFALTIATWPTALLAQNPKDPVAAQLKRQGDGAIESGKFEEALDAYSKALSAEPSPSLHYNRGRALQALGRNAEALDEFERFERAASTELRLAVPELNEMIALVRRQVAEVTVKCAVPGATLHVSGKVLSLPLHKPLRFDPTSLELEVVANGFEPWRTRVTLDGGETRELVPQLKRQDSRGTLTVASSVAGAQVEVDGRTAGTVPVELRLAPGEHSITLKHADFQTASTAVVLRPKERRSISIAMQQSPRFYERWWFWTGVGTAVVTGVVVSVALSTERAPAKGDIPPGQITSSLVAW